MQHPSTWFTESRAFWRRLLRRDRAEAGPIRLNRHRVYILPTRHGFILALVLLAMLLGAINYNNSLAYALTFLLTGLAVNGIIHTFRNLHDLGFSSGHNQPVFAGEEALFALSIDNRDGGERLALELKQTGGATTLLDLAANSQHWVNLHVPTSRRGYLPLPRITVATRFPLGLFRAWGYLHLDTACLVYPRPTDRRGLPSELLSAGEGSGDKGHGSDDFASLRPYHPGDSLRHIHWPAYAREQGLQTKQFGGDRSEELWLHWEMCGRQAIEERLSTLCRWVLEADGGGYRYGLVLPNERIEPGRGSDHRHRCLKALALFGETR